MKMSEEHKRKLSEANKGKKPWNTGKPRSEETKEKIRNKLTGQKQSEERIMKVSNALRGRTRPPFSKEWIKNISESRKGHVQTEETKYKIGCASKGRHHSEETKNKLSESHKGANSSLWKGGVSPQNKVLRRGIEFRQWREAVFSRDNWTCQKTGIRGGKLHPHHILNFSSNPDLRFEVNNGITLSEESHKKFHRKYGKINNTMEQLNEFLEKETDIIPGWGKFSEVVNNV
jgi:hypothetical protein